VARWCKNEGQRVARIIAAAADAEAASPLPAGSFELLLRVLHAGELVLPPPKSSGAGPEPPEGGDEHEREPAAIACKEEGNQLFKAGRMEEALMQFEAAAQLLGRAQLAATLLSNRAAAGLKLGNRPAQLSALCDAGAALAIDHEGSQPKARFRLVLSLEALGWVPEAKLACDAVLRGLDKEEARPLRTLREKLAAGPSGASIRNKLIRIHKQTGQRDVDNIRHELMEQERIMMQRTMRGAPAFKNKLLQNMLLFDGPLFDERVPPFHEQFKQAGQMPDRCDVGRCSRMLHSAYEYAVSVRKRELLITNVQPLPKDGPDAPIVEGVHVSKGEAAKRLHSFEKDDLMWLLHGAEEVGDVRDFNPSPYESGLHHSFNNASLPSLVLLPGKTHVGVGFTDLAVLSASIAGSGHGDGGEQSDPMRWIGYEVSAYAVAKTAAIVAMMQHGVPVDAMPQVWYSAA
jgi:tetratricopeptide (TPR) repeat protein